MEKWPNFLIVVAPRAGTTPLYDFLERTDRIFLENLYRNDVIVLQKTLGRKLPWKWVNN